MFWNISGVPYDPDQTYRDFLLWIIGNWEETFGVSPQIYPAPWYRAHVQSKNDIHILLLVSLTYQEINLLVPELFF